MRKRFSLLAVFALLLTAGLTVAAEPGQRGSHRGGHFGDRLAERLDLTADQKAAWETLRDEHRAQMEPLMTQIHEQRDQIREALESGSADATAVGQLMINNHRLLEQIKASREALDEAFRGLLTTEQQQTLDEIKASRGERGDRSHRGHRGHRGGGPGFGL
ncbi:MAG: Spy/CpxP family protein refolding chaperone [Acidobacteriota bacterium]|nr:Spy/CpxP family protein refolding chaperone [Acidobacteriota bacterium]